MSKYTTEVRYICETYAGLTESVDYLGVEQVIAKALPKVFDFPFPIFDESYRSVLEAKILRHYYTREIGMETTGLWKLKLNTKLNEIMPYYNKLYKSELLDFNPLYDIDLTTERKTSGNGTTDTTNIENKSGEVTENKNGENSATTRQDTENDNSETLEEGIGRKGDSNSNTSNTQNQTNTVNSTNMYSDTPQGAITDLAAGKYLTNATIDNSTGTLVGTNTGTNSVTNSEDVNSSRETSGESSSTVKGSNDGNFSENSNASSKNKLEGSSSSTMTNTEDYLEHVSGSNGGGSFSKKILEYRETFINIDMMVINELSDLFFGLW